MAKKTKSKTIAKRISDLEKMVAGFFSGATATSKARVKRASKRVNAVGKRVKSTAKRAKAAGAKRAATAKRAVKRAVKTARRKAALT